MRNRVEMIDWTVHGDRVRLTYSDGDSFDVSKTDFNRAFGAILGADKEDVIAGFKIKE